MTSATENTPARFSGLKDRDQIITCGLIKNNSLTTRKGVLTKVYLENAAREGKTLILVTKRPKC